MSPLPGTGTPGQPLAGRICGSSIVLLLFILALGGCGVVPLAEACTQQHVLQRRTVEGYLVVSWCHDLDGLITCSAFIEDDGARVGLIVNTNPSFRAGLYPKLSGEAVRHLFCGADTSCNWGRGQTRFRATGTCGPTGNLSTNNLRDVRPAGRLRSSTWILLGGGLGLGAAVGAWFYRRARQRPAAPLAAGAARQEPSAAGPGELTPEEQAVLVLLAEARADEEIARSLRVPVQHILEVKTALFHKFAVNRDDDLVWEARKRGCLANR